MTAQMGHFQRGPACYALLNIQSIHTSNLVDGVQAMHSTLRASEMAHVMPAPVFDTPADQYLFLVSGETRLQCIWVWIVVLQIASLHVLI